MEVIYHGQQGCSAVTKSGKNAGQQCKNKGYYLQNGSILCGQHSSKKLRTDLPKNPNAKADKARNLELELLRVEEVASLNKANGQKGKVIVSKLKMMKGIDSVNGFYKVFPNFKHGNRKDGYGCPELSPKSIGPVPHIMPNLPVARNIENFHQFAKVFSFEVDENGNQKPEYFEARKKGYLDPVPHRHKHSREVLKKLSGNINIPLYSIFYNKDGREHRFDYLGCRYFYCKKYEELTKDSQALRQLRDWIASGVNLQIVGYDGYPVFDDDTISDKSQEDFINKLMDWYCDTSRPFGHELVLYTLLVLDAPENYPWNRIYQANLHMYEGIGI